MFLMDSACLRHRQFLLAKPRFRSTLPNTMLGNEIGRLRIAGHLEGLSFLVLLFIAMPLKYIWDQPMAVSIVGMAHGVLFLSYCLLLVLAWGEARWTLKRAALVFVACLLPFGPFLIDRGLRRDEARLLESRSRDASPA